MRKLITPVLYDGSLDGLNEVRPLDLADEVKVSLDVPILNVNPVNNSKLALGRLLRCTKDGALLTKNHNSFENVEERRLIITEEAITEVIEWSQKIFGFLWVFQSRFDINWLVWSDPTYTQRLLYLSLSGTTWVPFKGDTTYFLMNMDEAGEVVGYCYGVY